MTSPDGRERHIEYTYRGDRLFRPMAFDQLPETWDTPEARDAYFQGVVLCMRSVTTSNMSSGRFQSHVAQNLQDGGTIALAKRFRLDAGSTPSYSSVVDITSQAGFVCDQPFVFALTHRTHPDFNAKLYPLLVAGVSFHIEGLPLMPQFAVEKSQRPLHGLSRGDIVVEQIQAARSHMDDNGKVLAGVYWQKLLLETTIQFAQKEGFPRVVVRPAEQNIHVGHSFPLERARKHVNQTALDCGFIADGDVTSEGKFVFDLSS